MVLKILKWIVIAIVLTLVALWLWEGGYWKVAKYAQIIPNPLEVGFSSSSDQGPILPGQPKFWEVPETVDSASDAGYGQADYQNPSDHLYDENSYTDNPQPNTTYIYSPYRGSLTLRNITANEKDPRYEYLIVQANNILSSPINLSGWSLQSLVSGTRVVIPLAASPFIQGQINAVKPIILGSGDSAIVTSGSSPLGVSFRETQCTGYLAQPQVFSPPLANACPNPSDLLPRTTENEAKYGSLCLDYVEQLPHCTYPTPLPSKISPECRTFLINTYTYNGCVSAYQSRMSNVGSWRVYLASGVELWRNSHDVIRLLDDQGKTVDTVSY